MAWGDSSKGGDSGRVSAQLSEGVCKVFTNRWAFAALKENGAVASWGCPDYGGSMGVAETLLSSDCLQIETLSRGQRQGGFVALKADGTVVVWGKVGAHSDSLPVGAYNNLPSPALKLHSNDAACAVLTRDGQLDAIGDRTLGANIGTLSSSCAKQMIAGNHGESQRAEIFSTKVRTRFRRQAQVDKASPSADFCCLLQSLAFLSRQHLGIADIRDSEETIKIKSAFWRLEGGGRG